MLPESSRDARHLLLQDLTDLLLIRRGRAAVERLQLRLHQ
jgi:hypothetical protein